MPKKTFIQLEEKKKKLITDAFLREFALNNYENASISVVVKKLGIAKGSVYQYFDDKFDLFQYLLQKSVAVKTAFVGNIQREEFSTYWKYFEALFECGIQFDLAHLLESHFLHNLMQNLQVPSIKKFYNDLMNQSVEAFEKVAKVEIDKGLFRNDVSAKTLGFMLYKVGVSIQEQLAYSGEINPHDSIQQLQPVYLGKATKLMNLVREYIQIIRPSFDKQD